jgi:hypothetical protein
VIYYDRSGKVRAVGAEAMKESISEIAQDESWMKAEWYHSHNITKLLHFIYHFQGSNYTLDQKLVLVVVLVVNYAHFHLT